MRMAGSVAGSVLRIVVEGQQREGPTLERPERPEVALVQREDARRPVARCKDDNREVREARTKVGVAFIELRYGFEIFRLKTGNFKAALCQVCHKLSVALWTAELLEEEVDLRRYQWGQNPGLARRYQYSLRRKSLRVLRFGLSDDWAGIDEKSHG